MAACRQALICSSATLASRSKPLAVRTATPGPSAPPVIAGQRQAPAFQVPPRHREGDLRDPGFQRALAAVLVQLAMDAQEDLLAQLPRVLRMADHAIDDVPAQALVRSEERRVVTDH